MKDAVAWSGFYPYRERPFSREALKAKVPAKEQRAVNAMVQ